MKPPVTDTNAILAMRYALLSQPKDSAWLVATGTLTNIALLFATFPDTASHIKGLSIMGGAIGSGFSNAPLGAVKGEGERIGNHTRWAEFNIYCDPEAAQSIFSNPILTPKTTLIPLDVTHQVLASPAVQHLVLHGSCFTPSRSISVLRRLLHDLLIFFAQTYADVFGLIMGPPLHDPLAVAVLLADHETHKISYDDHGGERWSVQVIIDGSHHGSEAERRQVGRTIARPLANGQPGVRIPRSLDVQKFWTMLNDCIQWAEDKMTGKERQ